VCFDRGTLDGSEEMENIYAGRSNKVAEYCIGVIGRRSGLPFSQRSTPLGFVTVPEAGILPLVDQL
jgi:hypothetical protein